MAPGINLNALIVPLKLSYAHDIIFWVLTDQAKTKQKAEQFEGFNNVTHAAELRAALYKAGTHGACIVASIGLFTPPACIQILNMQATFLRQ